jgi:hypothetical protein
VAALSAIRARALVAQLDLTLAGVCLACLSFVSFPLDDGDEREVARQVRAMTPWLWDEGLDAQVLAAVRAACRRGIRDGPAALAELESIGARSTVAREVVRRLASMLVAQERRERKLGILALPQLPLAAPELN